MKENSTSSLSCGKGTRDFPVVATGLGVASCFAEPLLEKYFVPGRALQVAVALMQAVPVSLLARYVFQSRSLVKRFTATGDASQ